MGKGGLIGGAGGAGLGALIGLLAREPALGAEIGGAAGILGGMGAGAYKTDKKWLEHKGIQPTLLGMGKGRFTPEAAEKYLSEPKTAEKRAELLTTALRAIKDAPEHVKHAAAKYVGERL
jgi:hypothetical protein